MTQASRSCPLLRTGKGFPRRPDLQHLATSDERHRPHKPIPHFWSSDVARHGRCRSLPSLTGERGAAINRNKLRLLVPLSRGPISSARASHRLPPRLLSQFKLGPPQGVPGQSRALIRRGGDASCTATCSRTRRGPRRAPRRLAWRRQPLPEPPEVGLQLTPHQITWWPIGNVVPIGKVAG
jgi:hypothetical protein